MELHYFPVLTEGQAIQFFPLCISRMFVQILGEKVFLSSGCSVELNK